MEFNFMPQFAPVDIPACVDAFIGHWKPNAIILVESELWPNLIMSASRSAVAESDSEAAGSAQALPVDFDDRMVWMASSIHKGEEKVILCAHKKLVKILPNVDTIIVPRHPQLGQYIALIGELRDFYRLTPIAVIGGSFLPGLSGHNISEAVAGCAVLTGPHVGQISHMVSAMKRQNPLAVLQVSGEADLGTAMG
ncbi:putative 3-deoxy-D-manno-octulosonic acid transferase, mitochondrial [Drosera capensis]